MATPSELLHRWIWLTLLLVILVGCERTPRNPAAEIVNKSPDTVDAEDFETFELTLNGTPLDQPLTVTSGEVVTIEGRIQFKPDRFPIGTSGMLHLRFQPVGAPPQDWDNLQSVMDWPRPIADSLRYTGTVTADPGEYELRAYVILHGMYLDLPVHKLAAKGRVTVTPDHADRGK